MKKFLNMGVIGCSGMAEGHMTAIEKNPNAKLIAVCDIDLEKAKKSAEKFKIEHVFQDYRDLLAMEEIDGVVIVTPDQVHREQAIAALQAGKHVLCEKPLALCREDMEAIVQAAKESDKKFMVGQICRYTPGFKMAKELVERGEIGELTFVESEYAHDYTGIIRPGSWRADPLRNGVVGGGCHAVDLLRWIAGDPIRITAYANHKSFPELEYDDTTVAVMQFPNNVIGKVFVSISCKRQYTMRTVLYGTKGTIIVDNTTPHMTVFKNELTDTVVDGVKAINAPVLLPVKLANHNTIGEFNEFCEIVLEDKPVVTTAVEGAKTVAACMAIVESANELKTVEPDYNF
ncbi:MAG: Gfo/Idh/MocA family oxidoreductase [Clostridia bacterium]|nr:Gfo/Idh/MocA family oxidoreductase [Clostridia bacterium]